jgi:hypothetical protein
MKVPEPQPAGRPGLPGLWRGMRDKVFKFGMERVLKWDGEVRQAEGFLDLESRRCAIDYGAYAELVHGSNHWSGRSGRALATLPQKPVLALSPLWLFDLLRGVTEAAGLGSESVRGRACQRLRASVDLARVSDQVPSDIPLPPGAFFEELRQLPLELWLDDEGLVRRIRFQHRLFGEAFEKRTLELLDLGTDEAVDWSRLPLLKDPRTGAPA